MVKFQLLSDAWSSIGDWKVKKRTVKVKIWALWIWKSSIILPFKPFGLHWNCRRNIFVLKIDLMQDFLKFVFLAMPTFMCVNSGHMKANQTPPSSGQKRLYIILKNIRDKRQSTTCHLLETQHMNASLIFEAVSNVACSTWTKIEEARNANRPNVQRRDVMHIKKYLEEDRHHSKQTEGIISNIFI